MSSAAMNGDSASESSANEYSNRAPSAENVTSTDDDADFMAQAMGDYDAPSEDDARLIELVGFLVQGVVSHPEEVEVEEFLDDLGSIYGVRVHPEDIGRVIGKEGRVANALRQVVKAAAVKANTHVVVEILTDDDEDNAQIADSADSSDNSGDSV